MAEFRQTRDVEIRELAIVNHNQSAAIDLRPVSLEFAVYSSIHDNFVTGDLTILDAEGLIERLPIIGEELVVLSFSLPPQRPESAFPTNHALHVYRVNNRHDYEERSEVYTLRLCSPENVIALGSRVDRAYVNMPIHTMIQNSFEEYVYEDSYYSFFPLGRNLRKGIRTTTATSGRHSMIAPGVNPFEWINYLCREAVSDDEESASDFVFYEDRNGFHLRTISSMVNEIASKKLYVAETGVIKDGENHPGFPNDAIIVESMSVVDNVDVIRAHTSGLYQNTTDVYDPLLKRFRSVPYSYDADMYELGITNPTLTTLDEFKTNPLTSYFNEPRSTISRFLVEQVSDDAMTPYSEQGYLDGRTVDVHGNTLDVASASPFRRHETTGRRMVKSALMSTGIRIDVTIPGDNTLDPGSVVELYVPQRTFNRELRERYNLLFGNVSPRFLVESVCHRYDFTEGRFRTNARLVKDSLGTDPSTNVRGQEDLFV